MSTIYTTDVGTEIKLNTGADLGLASLVKIKAKPPDDGDLVELPATVVETTKVQHNKTALTLNEAGTWQLQAYVEFASTEFTGERANITIEAPLS